MIFVGADGEGICPHGYHDMHQEAVFQKVV